MPHTGATRHVQWTHSTVYYIYIAQQYSHGHVTYPLLVIRGCRAHSRHPASPGPGHVQRLKRPAERARLAACANRPACRTRAGNEVPRDPPVARRRRAQPERHPKRCGPLRGLSAAPPQSQNAPARPTRLRLAVSATCQQGFASRSEIFRKSQQGPGGLEGEPRSRAPGRHGSRALRSRRLTEQTPRAPCRLSIASPCASRGVTVFSLKPACLRLSLEARESKTEAGEPQFRAQGSSTLECRRSRGMRGGAWGPRRW